MGTAVGYALEGGRALVELMYCDFMGRAGDEIFNQLSKWQSMSGGLLRMPVVVRVSVGSKYGAQHSQDWSAMCAHVPGLKVVFPATPYDAKGLMYSALLGSDPVVFFESQRIYDMPEEFVPGGVPAGAYEIPIGEPDVKKTGKDLTILSVGATLYRVLEAARELETRFGLQCEVDRRAVDRALQLREGARVGAQDPQDRAGQRRLRARQRPADDGGHDHAARFRRPRRAAGGRGRAQLDHAGRRGGGRVLPVPGRHRRRGPRAHPAAARLRRPARLRPGGLAAPRDPRV